MGLSVLRRPDAWLARFGDEVPAFARTLLDDVRAAGADRARLPSVRRGAEALGVLRAQQGNAVAGLVEDLLALRTAADVPPAARAVDVALQLAVSAYVEELTALLTSKATRDPLTGLPNRAAFEEAIAQEIAGAPRNGAPVLVLVDCDHFKQVNDTNGHLAGDAVLVSVAEVLKASVRPSDVVCRLGGDEFAIVLPRTSAARGLQIGERLVAAAREAAGLRSGPVQVTFSVGVGFLTAPRNASALIAVADAALYDVKEHGRDDVRLGGDG